MTDHNRPELELLTNGDHVGAATVTKYFEPARLTQARILAELTKAELAERVGVSAAAIGQFESGISGLRPELLAVLARSLSVPVDFFAAGRPLGRLDVANIHFRSLRSTRAQDRAKAAVYAGQLWELTSALEKRVKFPELDLPKIIDGTAPIEAAQRLRKEWGIDSGPVAHLGATMESRGIVISLVLLSNSAITRVSAYSTDALGRPLVVITPERVRSVYRYRFTCAHELGHLLLHANPLPGDRQQEREADQFAAEFLTPRAEIEPLLPRSVRIADLERLSRQWGVSVESLVFRMGELGIVSESAIRRAHQRLAELAELRADEPLTSYPGEVPSLLNEAVDLATQCGFDRSALAAELRWTERHLMEVLGTVDNRPRLTVVR